MESFRISRGDNGQLVATSQLNAGTRRLVTNLVADSIGAPITYTLTVMDNQREDVGGPGCRPVGKAGDAGDEPAGR